VRTERQVTGGRLTEGLRRYAATLSCGVVLTYEARTLLPGVGEAVPCHRHGYCAVDARGPVRPHRNRTSRALRPRRSQEELLAFLSYCPVTTVHVLRRNRFTLRTVAAAQKEGLVEADLIEGRVTLCRTAE
jgi:hypothetical protein